MPTFDTPEAISIAMELSVGDALLTAADRPDTSVEVHPRNPAKKADVKAANETRVDYAGGRLRINGPKASLFGSVGSIDVTIETHGPGHTGQIVGATNAKGEEPRDRHLSPNDLWATVYRHLGIDWEHSFPDFSGRPMPILPYGAPIAELLPAV